MHKRRMTHAFVSVVIILWASALDILRPERVWGDYRVAVKLPYHGYIVNNRISLLE